MSDDESPAPAATTPSASADSSSIYPQYRPPKSMTRAEADKQIRLLSLMSSDQLKRLWGVLFGTSCYTDRRQFIIRRLEWRINTLVSGGISDRAMKRAHEIADDTLLRVKSRAYKIRMDEPTPPYNESDLIRKVYKGRYIDVCRTPNGFLYEGTLYRTLSEVSTLVAGYFVSGNKFFNLPTTRKYKNSKNHQQETEK